MQMEAKQLWQAVLGDMQVRLSRTAFDNWLRPTTIVGFADDVATIAAANTFSASTLQARYASQIEQVLSDIVGRPIRVTFTILNAGDDDEDERAARAADTAALIQDARVQHNRPESGRGQSARRAESRRPDAPEKPQPQQLRLSPTPTHGLNPRYVYEHYVVGSSNRFAHAASLSVAEQPGGRFNPFFVHGGVGLGKTHLLHAIGHRALELHADLTIVYVSSEKFTNDVINAIRSQKMEEFRARYRTIDILMIDDIQFIAGKESTQEEFFHTFNALYQSGKQVIISSDKPPKAIAALEDRMRSRFEGGLIADVQLPDYEMRTAILRSKADELGETLPSDVIEYIAQKDQSNIRELEGALNKVLFHAQVTGHPVTLQLAMEALTDSSISNRRQNITAAEVVEAVAKHYGVSLKDLMGRGRRQEIVTPRQVAMYLLREETEASLVDIGQELGKRDHTTVMHGISKIERELETDTARRSQLMAIREALYTGATP
jgi:chromosomal replication initiator protein